MTRGAFDSRQAPWAQAFVDPLDLAPLTRGVTDLVEATYPENRIVIAYNEATPCFPAAYDERGFELDYEEVAEAARALGLATAERHAFPSILGIASFTRAFSAFRESGGIPIPQPDSDISRRWQGPSLGRWVGAWRGLTVRICGTG